MPFRTIFQVKVKLWHQFNMFCVLAGLNNECAVSLPVSLMNGLFKTIFHIHLRFCLPGDLKNKYAEFLCKSLWWITSSRPSSKQNYNINLMKCVSQETWTMKVQTTVLSSVSDKKPFQVHLPSQTPLTQNSVSQVTWKMNMLSCHQCLLTNSLFMTIFWVKLLYWPDELYLSGDLNNEGADHSLYQCHWQTAFSRPSFR